MITVLFTPKEDITAYELARIVANLIVRERAPKHGVKMDEKAWDELPENIRRHFTVKP